MTATDAPPAITLTSDFGLADPYVAAMKGVILSISPAARIVDVSHDVRSRSIVQALYITQAAWPFFPRATVHVAVVDPGVGTERRALALETLDGLFIGPDNGVLSSALPEQARPAPGEAPAAVALPGGCRCVSITSERYLRPPVSPTFHGRDVFAPAAAHLSLGTTLEALGEPVDSMFAYPPLRAVRCPDGSLRGRVTHIDRFGNAVTDIRAADLPAGHFAIELAGAIVRGLARTYADASGLAALVGSSGYIEVALPGASASAQLGVAPGDEVRLRPER